VGSFNNWKQIEKFCDRSAQDKAGVAVGILTRNINLNFGNYEVKFLLLYIDENLNYKLKPTYRFSYQELMVEGFENVLTRVGKKVIINIERNMKSKITTRFG
jgi:hypothetical protein